MPETNELRGRAVARSGSKVAKHKCFKSPGSVVRRIRIGCESDASSMSVTARVASRHSEGYNQDSNLWTETYLESCWSKPPNKQICTCRKPFGLLSYTRLYAVRIKTRQDHAKPRAHSILRILDAISVAFLPVQLLHR